MRDVVWEIVFRLIFFRRSNCSNRSAFSRGNPGGGAGGLNRLATQTRFFVANALLWAEVRNALLVAAVAASYLLLLAPYVVRVKVDQIMQVKHTKSAVVAAADYFTVLPSFPCGSAGFCAVNALYVAPITVFVDYFAGLQLQLLLPPPRAPPGGALHFLSIGVGILLRLLQLHLRQLPAPGPGQLDRGVPGGVGGCRCRC